MHSVWNKTINLYYEGEETMNVSICNVYMESTRKISISLLINWVSVAKRLTLDPSFPLFARWCFRD